MPFLKFSKYELDGAREPFVHGSFKDWTYVYMAACG
jgi:hypothetical protein